MDEKTKALEVLKNSIGPESVNFLWGVVAIGSILLAENLQNEAAIGMCNALFGAAVMKVRGGDK